jgi:hypothetical protein
VPDPKNELAVLNLDEEVGAKIALKIKTNSSNGDVHAALVFISHIPVKN